MSAGDASDDADDFDLPGIESDTVATGAAADSSDCDERLKGLPRLLRYVLMVGDNADHVEARLVAEIDELCPDLPLNAAWAAALDVTTGLVLAAELDHRAVAQDDPNLRSFADCVRLLCLPTPRELTYFNDHRRVAKALLQALHKAERDGDERLSCTIEQFAFGWAALPACTDLLSLHQRAVENAAIVGMRMAENRVAYAKAEAFRDTKRTEGERTRENNAEEKAAGTSRAFSSVEAAPDLHLVVARLGGDEMKNVKLKEILGPLKGVINTALPLVEVPPLHQVRSTLLFEFPYAADVIDCVLADLVGRATVRLRPLLLLGSVGAGKTFFVRKLSQALSLPSIWRTDSSRADGATFGGTDRRWHSAEPCHPLLAVAQAKIGNPLVLLDELEKAGTRSDYGRLWDCLLGFLEPETSCRYPDPALQVTLDLSQVSYIATANSLDPLPGPLRDRMRVVRFREPSANDLNGILPAVIADLARERGLDGSWVPPLDGAEHAAVARHWRGGSVRRLRRIVEAVLRQRDLHATRN
jgi:ATP-dependent Lon protease